MKLVPTRSVAPPHTSVASNRTPRHINSRVLLNIIRRQQPLSRADLSRKSGLRPSTVSLIVDELIASGWVLEGEISKSARGRRPTMLSLNPQRCVIAVDIHPSQVTIAVVDISGRIGFEQVLNLPDDPPRAISTLASALKKLIRTHSEVLFDGIGICLPGRTDISAKQLIFAPNLHWPVVSLKPRIERATGLPVVMDNVANACALSEVWFGTRSETRDFVVVAISEGIGTGLFVNGAVARGEAGMAGEFGHVPIAEDGPLCNCGNHGCWETFASTRAALRIYREISGDRRRISFANLLEMGTNQHPAATEALAQVARNLGRGMRIVATALAPAEIIVVGEITRIWSSIGQIVEDTVHEIPLSRKIRIRPALDSASARLRSAVALVLSDDRFAGALNE
ncbi:MAG TPA: ROK family transcriptional regulator [Acidobacteriaceae bacterium]|nr:ROK family transcriptional regulator [Acidobacteriaceae bacterium]